MQLTLCGPSDYEQVLDDVLARGEPQMSITHTLPQDPEQLLAAFMAGNEIIVYGIDSPEVAWQVGVLVSLKLPFEARDLDTDYLEEDT